MSVEERICKVQTELEKKLLIIGELTRQLAPEGVRPITVGGTAVEIYSAGEYQTYDVDLVVAPRERAIQVLEAMGFQRAGRVWHHPEWDAVVEIPDECLAGDMARVNTVEIDGYQIDCIGLEDLIIDRLSAAVRWGRVKIDAGWRPCRAPISRSWISNICRHAHSRKRFKPSSRNSGKRRNPMANYRWEELKARHAEVRQLLLKRGTLKRLPRSRPRDSDEERLLIEIAVRRIRRARAEGRFMKLGDRRWRLRLGEGVQ